ncbi:MAG: hypothetical protein EXX96DRAFT_622070 [Benjaminiella poitrasii]|nr:MAG: hypothetical protein EXX96DRAFT_622070 [Benjaminiella poitrasii]
MQLNNDQKKKQKPLPKVFQRLGKPVPNNANNQNSHKKRSFSTPNDNVGFRIARPHSSNSMDTALHYNPNINYSNNNNNNNNSNIQPLFNANQFINAPLQLSPAPLSNNNEFSFLRSQQQIEGRSSVISFVRDHNTITPPFHHQFFNLNNIPFNAVQHTPTSTPVVPLLPTTTTTTMANTIPVVQNTSDKIELQRKASTTVNDTDADTGNANNPKQRFITISKKNRSVSLDDKEKDESTSKNTDARKKDEESNKDNKHQDNSLSERDRLAKSIQIIASRRIGSDIKRDNKKEKRRRSSASSVSTNNDSGESDDLDSDETISHINRKVVLVSSSSASKRDHDYHHHHHHRGRSSSVQSRRSSDSRSPSRRKKRRSRRSSSKSDESDMEEDRTRGRRRNRSRSSSPRSKSRSRSRHRSKKRRSLSPARRKRRNDSPSSSCDEEKAPFIRSQPDYYIPNYNKRPLPPQYRRYRSPPSPSPPLSNTTSTSKKSSNALHINTSSGNNGEKRKSKSNYSLPPGSKSAPSTPRKELRNYPPLGASTPPTTPKESKSNSSSNGYFNKSQMSTTTTTTTTTTSTRANDITKNNATSLSSSNTNVIKASSSKATVITTTKAIVPKSDTPDTTIISNDIAAVANVITISPETTTNTKNNCKDSSAPAMTEKSSTSEDKVTSKQQTHDSVANTQKPSIKQESLTPTLSSSPNSSDAKIKNVFTLIPEQSITVITNSAQDSLSTVNSSKQAHSSMQPSNTATDNEPIAQVNNRANDNTYAPEEPQHHIDESSVNHQPQDAANISVSVIQTNTAAQEQSTMDKDSYAVEEAQPLPSLGTATTIVSSPKEIQAFDINSDNNDSVSVAAAAATTTTTNTVSVPSSTTAANQQRIEPMAEENISIMSAANNATHTIANMNHTMNITATMTSSSQMEAVLPTASTDTTNTNTSDVANSSQYVDCENANLIPTPSVSTEALSSIDQLVNPVGVVEENAALKASTNQTRSDHTNSSAPTMITGNAPTIENHIINNSTMNVVQTPPINMPVSDALPPNSNSSDAQLLSSPISISSELSQKTTTTDSSKYAIPVKEPVVTVSTTVRSTGRKRLPSPWKVKMSDMGDIYYHNPVTGETTSVRPE